MVAWVVCACCSGSRNRRQQYRYEVVYRREESLYSGPDYLESLPGHSAIAPPRVEGGAQAHRPEDQEYLKGEEKCPIGRRAIVTATTDVFSRENRVNDLLTALNEGASSRGDPKALHSLAWRSTGHLLSPDAASPYQQHLVTSRSVPLLQPEHLNYPLHHFPTTAPLPYHRQEPSLSSRDVSVASSGANSARPLLQRAPFPPGRWSASVLSVQPPPHSPHTPISPGPPAYPFDFSRPLSTARSQGSIPQDLRQYLNTRFPKGGVDHDLQNTIRDNVYLRTVPVTTRPPRQGEVNGVDYTFLSHEEFRALQKSGNLLESGVFEGNQYGTPKPPSVPPDSSVRGSGLSLLPGAHPSSEGKRRRNRSNVEAMAANTTTVEPLESSNFVSSPYISPTSKSEDTEILPSDSPTTRELGPLPPHWEKAVTENGDPYFIDHLKGVSSWLDPRLAKVQKRSAEECSYDELPFGWERIDDPQFGTYYIDHVNKTTQYENPVHVAKQQRENNPVQEQSSSEHSNTFPRQKKSSVDIGSVSPGKSSDTNSQPPASSKRSSSRNMHASVFTRNPAELQGEFLRTSLKKSSRGLGFTIVGGDDNEEEFLQIKSVVPNGPAWQDGKLRTGDVLVYVNDTCVLGYTHADVVNMFQNIEPGQIVYLEVCRGYPLPFDPNDPNTEIVTTVAVTSSDSKSAKSLFAENFPTRSPNNSNESLNTAKSMPDLSNAERIQVPRPGSADLLSSENVDHAPDILDFYAGSMGKPEFLTIPIVKGTSGFGFTIADSAFGQKVKKILDSSRCKNLIEGDILVDINNINVKGMNHTEVVQVLKDCPEGKEAIIMVQRGISSPSKSRSSRKDLPTAKKAVAGAYRSKTPTADMYSSQPKEVIPNRPKTPLVDTRTWSTTPDALTSYENAGVTGGYEGSSECRPQYSQPSIPPHPGAFSYTAPNNISEPVDTKLNNISSQMDKMHISPYFTNYENYKHEMNHQFLANSYSESANLPYQNYPNDNNYDNAGKQMPNANMDRGNYVNTGYPNYMYQDSYYPSPVESYDYSNKRPFTKVPKRGYSSPEMPQYPYYNSNGSAELKQDSGYCSQTHGPHLHQPYFPDSGTVPGTSYGQSDSMGRKKESTSFEYEHPAPVSMPRFPDGRYSVNSRYMSGGSNGVVPGTEFTVVLRRHESGFGFRIVGGTEEGSQVSIGHIVPGGAADQDGSVATGDEIIGVDGESVLGSSHHHVVQLMAAAASQGRVTLALRKRLGYSHAGARGFPGSNDFHNRSMETQYPYNVTVKRSESEGFGFVIISSVTKSGSTIGRILEGSPAERCGQLQVGDRILAVNNTNIKTLHHGAIVNLIKESGYSVTLTIGSPSDDASSTASNSQRGDSEMGEEGEFYSVELKRGTRGFGFSIRGGREFHNMPLFVLRIAENGPAAEDDKIKVGDQLIEINGISTKDMTHAEAIELIKQCGTTVRLVIKRGGRIPYHFDPCSPPNLGSPVGPPPPGSVVRSSATLPPPSPDAGPAQYNPANYQGLVLPNAYTSTTFAPSLAGYGQPYGGASVGGRSPHGPLHSSPAMYSMTASHNGPLGQSSPRMLAGGDAYYWNRPDQRPV